MIAASKWDEFTDVVLFGELEQGDLIIWPTDESSLILSVHPPPSARMTTALVDVNYLYTSPDTFKKAHRVGGRTSQFGTNCKYIKRKKK